MSTLLPDHVRRRALAVVQERMREEPALLLEGPRTVGKSTLLADIAARVQAPVLDLDDPGNLSFARDDPSFAVSGPSPVLIDEYQLAPPLLAAIKARLNRDSSPGQVVLTGSARHEALPRASQALTGRLHRMTIYPLSQGEIGETDEDFLRCAIGDRDRLFSDSLTPRSDYVVRLTAGGFPMALRRETTAARARWFADYVRLTLERDVTELSKVRQAEALPRLLARLAGQTGQILDIAGAANKVDLPATTATDYVRLLESVFLLWRLPAWGRTLTARSAAKPKIHMFDSGLAAYLLRLPAERLERKDPAAQTEFGHLLKTFAVNEIAKQASWLDEPVELGHWRTHDGVEVDLIIERMDGSVIAFEIKASSSIQARDWAPLAKLRAALGPAFEFGAVLYLGPRAYRHDDTLAAIPLDRLWRAA